jgi:hypothetical protein
MSHVKKWVGAGLSRSSRMNSPNSRILLNHIQNVDTEADNFPPFGQRSTCVLGLLKNLRAEGVSADAFTRH